MALRKTLTFAGMALGLTLALGAPVFAQQPQDGDSQQQQRERGGRRRGGPRDKAFGMGRALRALNLSEAQQQQVRSIMDRYGAATRPQREQLRQLREQFREGQPTDDVKERAKALRAQLHESGKAMRAEILGVLTQEQRTQLEQMEAERKSRRDAWRQKRQGGGQPETR